MIYMLFNCDPTMFNILFIMHYIYFLSNIHILKYYIHRERGGRDSIFENN